MSLDPSLIRAIEALIAAPEQRERIVSLRLSTAEAGSNSKGYAQIVLEENGARLICTYVSRMALSLTRAGGEEGFDHERRYAQASRELVLNKKFFKSLTKRIELARSMPPALDGDGSEYDAEEAKQARLKRLGTTARSSYLMIGVDNQVTWPKEETLVKFGDYQLVLTPKAKEHLQSVAIDLHENNLDMETGLTLIHRMLSVMTWCDDQYAVAQGGWSGSPVPQPVPKRDPAPTNGPSTEMCRDRWRRAALSRSTARRETRSRILW